MSCLASRKLAAAAFSTRFKRSRTLDSILKLEYVLDFQNWSRFPMGLWPRLSSTTRIKIAAVVIFVSRMVNSDASRLSTSNLGGDCLGLCDSSHNRKCFAVVDREGESIGYQTHLHSHCDHMCRIYYSCDDKHLVQVFWCRSILPKSI